LFLSKQSSIKIPSSSTHSVEPARWPTSHPLTLLTGRSFHRWISFTDSEVGLVLLLCSQITFDPSSIKTAHATPTEKSTPPLVPRHSPVQVPHGHCRRSSRPISFHFVRRSPITPYCKSHWVVPALELTPASPKHCTRLAYPHLRYTAREGVSQGPLPVGRTAALQWVRRCVVLPICVHRPEVVVQPFVPASGEHKSSVKLPRLSVAPSDVGRRVSG